MISTKNCGHSQESQEARAFLARLAALNVMFEAARAGTQAQGYAQNAQPCDALLTAFLDDLKSKNNQ